MRKKENYHTRRARLASLSHLKAGWLDGEGEAITEVSIQAADHILSMFSELSNLVSIFPTLEGGISLESKGSPFFYFDIEPDGTVELTDMTESEQSPNIETYGPFSGNHNLVRDFNVRVYRMINKSRIINDGIENGHNGPSGREARLDSLMRAILPSLNLMTLPGKTRDAVLREYVELRASNSRHDVEIGFVVTEEYFFYDELIMGQVTSAAGHGILMRLDEALTGHSYILAFPGARRLQDLKDGTIDMRSAMLEAGCLFYTAQVLDYEDGMTRGSAVEMRGYLSEDFLPEPDLFLKDLAPQVEAPDVS